MIAWMLMTLWMFNQPLQNERAYMDRWERGCRQPKDAKTIYLSGVKTGWWLAETRKFQDAKQLKQNYGIDKWINW